MGAVFSLPSFSPAPPYSPSPFFPCVGMHKNKIQRLDKRRKSHQKFTVADLFYHYFDALSDTFADSRTRLIGDVYTITSSELKTGWFAGEATRVQAVKDDALQMAGDNSYQIDIGV